MSKPSGPSPKSSGKSSGKTPGKTPAKSPGKTPGKATSRSPGKINFVTEYTNPRTGKLMIASDYGYKSWPLGKK
jgi:hypothetical protein